MATCQVLGETRDRDQALIRHKACEVWAVARLRARSLIVTPNVIEIELKNLPSAQ
jgi:hypothetical protein